MAGYFSFNAETAERGVLRLGEALQPARRPPRRGARAARPGVPRRAVHPGRGRRRRGAGLGGEAAARPVRRHNASGVTEPLDPSTRAYHERPARVLMADRFTEACLATVTDPALRPLPLIGGVDQAVDSTDVLTAPRRYRRLAVLYTGRD